MAAICCRSVFSIVSKVYHASGGYVKRLLQYRHMKFNAMQRSVANDTKRSHYVDRDMMRVPERYLSNTFVNRLTWARRSTEKSAIKTRAKNALFRARRAKDEGRLIEAVLAAELNIARLRAYDAAGYFRGNNHAELVKLERQLRTLKTVPAVRAALEL